LTLSIIYLEYNMLQLLPRVRLTVSGVTMAGAYLSHGRVTVTMIAEIILTNTRVSAVVCSTSNYVKMIGLKIIRPMAH